MKKHVIDILAGLLVCLAVVAIVYQKVSGTYPTWFHFDEIWSYDVMALCGVVAVIALIIGKYTVKRWS